MTRCRACGRPLDGAAGESGLRGVPGSALRLDPADSRLGRGCEGMPDAVAALEADPDSATPIHVEANVLACCNAAYDRAAQAGRAEVLLLDLLYVLAGTATLEAWLVAYDIDRDLLRIELDTLEEEIVDRGAEADASPTGLPPRTSRAMRQALSAARASAERRLALFVTIGDLLLAAAADERDEAGALLAAHVARQRQRRRGGMRSGRGEAGSPFGPLQGVAQEAAPRDPLSRRDSLGGGHAVDWLSRELGVAATGDSAGARPAAGWPSDSTGAEASAREHSAVDYWAPLDGTAEQGARILETIDGWTASQEGRFAGSMRPVADVHSGFGDGRALGTTGWDDLYRPGEREPSDGWHRAPDWRSIPAASDATRSGRDGGGGAEAAWPASGQRSDRGPLAAAGLRDLMIKLAEWRSEMAARLDEQDLQLEGIAAQLVGVAETLPAVADDFAAEERPDAEDDEAATIAETAARRDAPGDAADAQATGKSPAAPVAARPSATAAAAGTAKRRHLDRAAMRTHMRRTLSRRRAARAALAKQALEAARSRQRLAVASVADTQARMAAPALAAKTARPRPDASAPITTAHEVSAKVRFENSPRDRGRRGASDDEDADDIVNGVRQKRFYLSMDDDIVEAPSIGPRTAERLRAHGIDAVRDLLSVKAHVLAARVGVRHITAERITGWQHQARLVCTIPWLRGTHAQILVGSGYYAPHSIVTANRDALCTAILRFSTTRVGQSVLRSAPPPSLGKIMRWVEQAALAEADRAA